MRKAHSARTTLFFPNRLPANFDQLFVAPPVDSACFGATMTLYPSTTTVTSLVSDMPGCLPSTCRVPGAWKSWSLRPQTTHTLSKPAKMPCKAFGTPQTSRKSNNPAERVLEPARALKSQTPGNLDRLDCLENMDRLNRPAPCAPSQLFTGRSSSVRHKEALILNITDVRAWTCSFSTADGRRQARQPLLNPPAAT